MDSISVTSGRSVTVTTEQLAALGDAVLRAWGDLRRDGFQPHRLEADWPACYALRRCEKVTLGGPFGVLYGMEIEGHDDPGLRVVGKRGDMFRTVSLEPWP